MRKQRNSIVSQTPLQCALGATTSSEIGNKYYRHIQTHKQIERERQKNRYILACIFIVINPKLISISTRNVNKGFVPHRNTT
jgi:hypothetical protein